MPGCWRSANASTCCSGDCIALDVLTPKNAARKFTFGLPASAPSENPREEKQHSCVQPLTIEKFCAIAGVHAAGHSNAAGTGKDGA